MAVKTCTKCKVEKDIEEFGNCRSNKDGKNYKCKLCMDEYNADNKERTNKNRRQYYKDNKDKIKKYADKYKAGNKERINESRKQYRIDNKDKIKKYADDNKDKIKMYRENNKDKSKQYYEDNKEQHRERGKLYRKNNKERILERNKIYRKDNEELFRELEKKYRIDNSDKIKKYRKDNIIRHRVLSQSSRIKKDFNPLEVLGCTIEEYKVYLQCTADSKYIDCEFNIENFITKDYHIDHIKPLSSFNFDNYNEIEECFHYSNTQILKAHDNLTKGNKIIPKK